MEHQNSGLIQSEMFSELGISHGTSTKSLGNMSMSRDQDGQVERNLNDVFRLLDIQQEKDTILFLNLTHSANVALVKKIEGRNVI